MEMTDEKNEAQAQLWNGTAGRAWVDLEALIEAAFGPIGTWLADEAERLRARRVLDVGCGTGGTTLDIARRVAPEGECLGVDLSAAMVDRAARRAAEAGVCARFLAADAQDADLSPGGFDLIVSRFGVMFFADPVAAFANLCRSARKGGGLAFVAFRGPEENPFMTAAERAAAPHLPEMPPRPKDGPGQFAFADADRVRAILDEAGWSDIRIEPVDFACAFPEAGLVQYFTRLGPLGLFLQQADAAVRARMIDAVRPAFDPFVAGGEIRFTAACWAVKARREALDVRRVELRTG